MVGGGGGGGEKAHFWEGRGIGLREVLGEGGGVWGSESKYLCAGKYGVECRLSKRYKVLII